MDDDLHRPRTASIAPRASLPADSSRDVAGEEFLFHLYRGSELLQDSREHEAKEELEHALMLQPRDPKGQDLLGVVYFRLGLYPRAIQIYEQLKIDNPSEVSIQLNLALCYLKTGQAQAARAELEEVVRASPEHRRAWGYLGLAYERLGDSEKAEQAFERGGHAQMARRIADKIAEKRAVSVGVPSSEAQHAAVRAAAAKAFQDLDAGELSFALAEPAKERRDSGTWRAVELGEAVKGPREPRDPLESARKMPAPVISEHPAPSSAPASFRNFSPPPPPPAPKFTPIPAPMPAPVQASAPPPPPKPRFSTPPPARPEAPRRAAAVAPTRAPTMAMLPALDDVARAARIHPADAAMVLDPTGLLSLRLVSSDRASSSRPLREFGVRFEALRAYTGSLDMAVLDRRARAGAKAEAREPFGGPFGALARISGEGVLVLGPRPSRHFVAAQLRDEVVFLREDVVVAFDLSIPFENGKLARGDEEPIALVQLRGPGEIAFELGDPLRSIEVAATRPATARVHAIIGWIGRLIPRVLTPAEAPGGQKGLVTFAGEGMLLLSGR